MRSLGNDDASLSCPIQSKYGVSTPISIPNVFSDAPFLLQLNGASLSWYPQAFCFELSLSNYLAGVTSLKPKKAWEAEKVLPVE